MTFQEPWQKLSVIVGEGLIVAVFAFFDIWKCMAQTPDNSRELVVGLKGRSAFPSSVVTAGRTVEPT